MIEEVWVEAASPQGCKEYGVPPSMLNLIKREGA
jgi:hypothetical protein